MILLFLVIVGVSVFSFLKGYYLIGIICLFGFSHKIGMIALFIASLFLLTKGHLVVGVLPLLLILWNLIGLRFFYKNDLFVED